MEVCAFHNVTCEVVFKRYTQQNKERKGIVFQFFIKITCADPEIFMRGGPTKMVIFGNRRGGGPTPKKSLNYLFFR